MTALLEQAFKKASSLPDELQDTMAQNILRELKWESQWDETLESSQDMLDDMAIKALNEFENGRTEAKGFGDL